MYQFNKKNHIKRMIAWAKKHELQKQRNLSLNRSLASTVDDSASERAGERQPGIKPGDDARTKSPTTCCMNLSPSVIHSFWNIKKR